MSENSSENRYVLSGNGSVRRHGSRWQLVLLYTDVTTGKRSALTKSSGAACRAGSDAGRTEAMRELAAFRREAAMRVAGMNAAAAEERERLVAADGGAPRSGSVVKAPVAVEPVYEAPDCGRPRARVVVAQPGGPVNIAVGAEDPWADLALGEALDRYIQTRLELKAITPATADDYGYSALHAKRSPIGGLAVADVTSDDINAWMAEKVRSGTAPATLRKSVKVIDRLYRYLLGRSNNTIPVNPCAGALKIPRTEQPRNALRAKLLPTLNEQVSRMPDGKFKRAIVLALHTGMRIGEVCALRWCDVDMEENLIHVRHSLGYARGVGSFIKDTKSHDARVVPIDEVGLRPWLETIRRKDMTEITCFLGKGASLDDTYILSGPGKPFATTSYIRRAFKTFSEANSLMGTNDELITFHGLRHTFATQWIRRGGDIKSLQSILGHKDATVTLNVYADIDPLSKQHNMALVAPGLWNGFAGVELNVSAGDSKRISEAVELLQAFGYRVIPPERRRGRPSGVDY